MTVCTADFELGSNGNDILTSDPGSLTAWDTVTTLGVTGAKYSNDLAAHGTLSAKFDNTSVVQQKDVEWSTAFGSNSDWYYRFYLYMTDLPPSDTFVFRTDGFSIRMMSDGRPRFFTAGAIIYTATAALSADTWYRLEGHVINSDTVGFVDYKVFVGDSTTPLETFTSAATQDTDPATTFLKFGVVETTSSGWILYIDDIVAGATSWPGPAGGAVAPQVLSMQTHVFGHGVW